MVAAIDKFVNRVDKLNHRIIYLMLVALLAAPFLIGQWSSKPTARPMTRGLYDQIEACAESGKPVLLINAWRMSSRGENQPQFEVVVDHMMRRRVKFIMWSFEPDTAIVCRALCQKIEQHYNEKFGEGYLEYGRDWLMIGYWPFYNLGGWPVFVPNMKSKGIVGSLETDYLGKNLWEYPIMARPGGAARRTTEPADSESPPVEDPDADPGRGGGEVDASLEDGDGNSDAPDDAGGASEAVESETGDSDEEDGLAVDPADYLQLEDLGLILEIHFTRTTDQIIGLVRLDKDLEGPDGKPQIEVALGTINMVVNEVLPFYDTRDLCGILAGFQGATEYSELLNDEYGHSPSRTGVRQRANAYSMGVLTVLFVIVLGNLCTLWKKLRERG